MNMGQKCDHVRHALRVALTPSDEGDPLTICHKVTCYRITQPLETFNNSWMDKLLKLGSLAVLIDLLKISFFKNYL